ncbi:MAG TPA: hypothetical protein PKI49_09900, partial [Pseudomonadota bacterium]|nr:hypothetical protein [Pseudomonadota bacterium]
MNLAATAHTGKTSKTQVIEMRAYNDILLACNWRPQIRAHIETRLRLCFVGCLYMKVRTIAADRSCMFGRLFCNEQLLFVFEPGRKQKSLFHGQIQCRNCSSFAGKIAR